MKKIISEITAYKRYIDEDVKTSKNKANRAKFESKRANGLMLHVALKKANALEEVAQHLKDYAAKKKSLALEIDKDNAV